MSIPNVRNGAFGTDLDGCAVVRMHIRGTIALLRDVRPWWPCVVVLMQCDADDARTRPQIFCWSWAVRMRGEYIHEYITILFHVCVVWHFHHPAWLRAYVCVCVWSCVIHVNDCLCVVKHMHGVYVWVCLYYDRGAGRASYIYSRIYCEILCNYCMRETIGNACTRYLYDFVLEYTRVADITAEIKQIYTNIYTSIYAKSKTNHF